MRLQPWPFPCGSCPHEQPSLCQVLNRFTAPMSLDAPRSTLRRLIVLIWEDEARIFNCAKQELDGITNAEQLASNKFLGRG
jgi:hypothetical protein